MAAASITPKAKARRIADRAETAEYLRTSDRHVRHLVETRGIPFVRVGRKIRFDLDVIDAWLDANTTEAAS